MLPTTSSNLRPFDVAVEWMHRWLFRKGFGEDHWEVMQQDFSWVVATQIFLMFIPKLGFHDPIWRAYSSNGLKQPTSFLTQFFVLFFSLIDVQSKSWNKKHSILGKMTTPWKLTNVPWKGTIFTGYFIWTNHQTFTGYVSFQGDNCWKVPIIKTKPLK